MSSGRKEKPRPVATPVLSVRFYKTATGAEPVRDWLLAMKEESEQGEEACKRIGADILKVQYRWPVSKPLVDSVGGGLFEVRTTHDKREFRVVFGIKDNVIVLLDGFRKPPNDYSNARKRWKEIKK